MLDTFFVSIPILYPHPAQALLDGLIGAMSIIMAFLIIASFLLDKDRLQRIAQVSLAAALILGSVAGAGLIWIDYDMFFPGQYLPLDDYIILRFVTHLGTVLAFLGIALIIYSFARAKLNSQVIK